MPDSRPHSERQNWYVAENKRLRAEAERSEKYAEERDLVAQRLEEQYEDVQRRLEASVPATHRLQVENRRLLEQLEAAEQLAEDRARYVHEQAARMGALQEQYAFEQKMHDSGLLS